MRFNKPIYFILLIALIIHLLFLFSSFIFWDAAVYIGMGKALFSFGKAGLWEPSRPLIWSFFLGLFWKLGLNVILFGRLLTSIFSIGCIYLVYLIGKDTFNEKTALIASLLLAFLPTFFNHNDSLLTAIPSTFFALLGIYLFFKDKIILSGVFLGISFLTRFYQGLVLLPLFLLPLFFKKDIKFKKILILLIPFLLTITPYLILNQLLYNNFIYPFLLQLFLSKESGWFWYEPFNFYFINLIKECFLLIFFLLGVILIFFNKNHKQTLIAFIAISFLILFSLVSHKEMRFMILALPYICLLAAYGLFSVLNNLKNKAMYFSIFVILISIWLLQAVPQVTAKPQDTANTDLQNYLKQDLKEPIWVSSPVYALYSDKKVNLFYYPVFSTKSIPGIKIKLKNAENILISTCNLECSPNDFNCPMEKESFIVFLKENFKKKYYNQLNNCESYIFTS